VELCAGIPLPDFNSLYALAASAMTFPPGNISIPPLPGIPDPIYPGFNSINMEILQIVQQLQSFQLLTTFLSFLQPLVAFLGISLDSILPKIPGTNLTLLDLLALDPSVIYNAIKGLPSLIGIPGIPYPLYYSFDAPAIQIANAVQGIINGYMNTLIGVVTNLIGQVVSILSIGGLPTIPTVPSITDLQALIIPLALTIPEVRALLNRYSLNELLALALPLLGGFPVLPALPDPLIPSVNIPETNLMVGLGILYANLVMYPMTIIFDFIQNTLGHFISFSFPTVCVSI